MRLSPPASSSDLDLARSIARRLSRLASPADGAEARPLPPYTPFRAARPAERPPETPRVQANAPPAPVANPETVRVARPAVSEPPAPKPAPPPRPAPPPVVEEELGVVDDEAPPPKPAPPPKAIPARPAPPPPPPPPVAEADAERAEIEAETEVEVPSRLAASPDMEEDFEAAAKAAAEAVPEIEPDAEAPAPASWADILQDCLYLARASGALLIDGQGEVAAYCGDWPPPGVEAIAARLVPAMDKALRAAPTRSVSVPIGNLHLTAWRVPVAETLVTVGFVAEAPLKAEVRPAIDAEVRRGTPA